jgi:hypothetical protein
MMRVAWLNRWIRRGERKQTVCEILRGKIDSLSDDELAAFLTDTASLSDAEFVERFGQSAQHPVNCLRAQAPQHPVSCRRVES